MPKHLQNAIENLKKMVLSLSATVEESVHNTMISIIERNVALAREIIEKDKEIDRREVELEEECLKILALHQPVAIDLRFIIAVLKINNDLERIGDEAVNIAERAEYLASKRRVDIAFDFSAMADKVQLMLKKSLDSLVRLDSRMAGEVCAQDDEVDKMYHEVYDKVKDAIRHQPEDLGSLIHILGIARHLERIADHATNIAEDVIYMIEGMIARHNNGIKNIWTESY